MIYALVCLLLLAACDDRSVVAYRIISTFSGKNSETIKCGYSYEIRDGSGVPHVVETKLWAPRDDGKCYAEDAPY